MVQDAAASDVRSARQVRTLCRVHLSERTLRISMQRHADANEISARGANKPQRRQRSASPRSISGSVQHGLGTTLRRQQAFGGRPLLPPRLSCGQQLSPQPPQFAPVRRGYPRLPSPRLCWSRGTALRGGTGWTPNDGIQSGQTSGRGRLRVTRWAHSRRRSGRTLRTTADHEGRHKSRRHNVG